MRRLLLTLAALALAAPAFAQSQALTRATLARDPDLQQRIAFLATKVALSVMAEPPTTCCGPDEEASVLLHAKREGMAALVLREPQGVAYRLTLAVLTDTTLNAQSSDADVEATLRAQWDAFAKAVAR